LAAGLIIGAGIGATSWWWALLATVLILVPGVGVWGRAVSVLLAATVIGGHLAPPDTQQPRLLSSVGTVEATQHGRYGQRFRFERSDAGPSERRLLSCSAPLTPGVRCGDDVMVRGRLEQGWRLTAVEIDVITAREHGPLADLWWVIDHSGDHSALAGTVLAGRGYAPERPWFRRSGLMHLLAVSGLHLGVVLAVVAVVARWARLPWWGRQLVVVATAAVCLWATGASPPTRRAFVMLLALVAARVASRTPHRLAAVSLAVVGLALWTPDDMATLGLQLSVAAVTGISTLGQDLIAVRR
jgi:hypothetical protein